MASPLELVSQAILASQSPASTQQQRRGAVELLEQFKKADAATILSTAAALTTNPGQGAGGALAGAPPAAQQSMLTGLMLAGYQLLGELVKARWPELGGEQAAGVTNLVLAALDSLFAGRGAAASSWALRTKVAEIVACVVRQRGAAAYNELLPMLTRAANSGPMQAEVCCKVLGFLSEDLTVFESSNTDITSTAASAVASASGSVSPGSTDNSKRAFLSALTASVATVFPLLCDVLQKQFQAGQAAGAAGGQAAAAPHLAALNAAMHALSTWVEWTPMGRLGASPVLEGCAFFIVTGAGADAAGGSSGGEANAALHELRLSALDVIRAIALRKRGNESWADYAGLMDKAAEQLLGACSTLGLLVPHSQPLPPALVSSLSWEGSQAEFGARLADTMVALGESHYRCLAEPARRAQFLQQALMLTRHPYLRLSYTMLTLWAQLTREAVAPHVLAAQQAQLAAAAAASGKAVDPRGVPYTLPMEACTGLISALATQLQVVVPAVDTGVDSFPEWADSHAEYKELMASYRGSVKTIIRQATQLAPEQSLQAAASYLATSMNAAAAAAATASAAQQPGAAAEQVRQARVLMESAAVVLAAALPPLCDLAAMLASSSGQEGAGAAVAVVAGLETLLRNVLRVRLSEPALVPLHAEAIEAFGRLLVLRPDLAADTISNILQMLGGDLIPMDVPGPAPPPAVLTPVWRARTEARIRLANAVLQLAKAAPAAVAPHLPALVGEVRAMWEGGRLGEGERVLLWEGMLASSQAAPAAVQEQMVACVLAPLHAEWTSPAWQAATASTAAFTATFLPVTSRAASHASASTSQPQPAYELGARDKRWTLYHQVTLLERSLRRTAPPDPGPPPGSLSPRTGPGVPPPMPLPSQLGPPPPEPAIAAHLSWLLPAVSRIISCSHGLLEPAAGAGLGPLASALSEMDPIERAVRLGEDRDVAKEAAEPRCVAGPLINDARYFLRGVREGSYMVLGLAGTHCSSMWTQPALASVLPAAITSSIQYQTHGSLRIMLRHLLTPWVNKCPPHLFAHWLPPVLRLLLPHMYERLRGGWATLLATSSGAAPPPAAAATQPGASSTTDEVLADTLLRETTREHVGLLAALVAPRAQISRAPSPSAGAPAQGRADSSAGPTGLEVLLVQEPAAAQSAVAAGISALTWPDADSAQKAVMFARSLLGLVQSGQVRSLDAVVAGDLLTAAIRGVAQVSTLVVQSQVLDVVRMILVMTLLPAHGHPQAPAVRALLGSLPGVTPPVLQSFEAAFGAAHTEKDQRGVIKQLLAEAGGEEVRKLLTAVSKMPPGAPPSIAEPRAPKARPGPNDPTPQDMGLPHLFD